MADWTKSMQQYFEYYIVDPGTWGDIKKLEKVKSSSIDWDLESETLGSATYEVDEEIGECYIRTYLITIQNGVKEKHPLGVFLVQTPSKNFDGKVATHSLDAYSPLLELREKNVPIGYYIPEYELDQDKNKIPTNIMDITYRLVRENMRAPVIEPTSDKELYSDFVADLTDNYLNFTIDLMSNAKYEYKLDDMGRVLFAPIQDTASLQPVWTYTDNNSSILYADVELNQDLYNIPNVVEVLYSDGTEYNSTTGKGGTYSVKVANYDPDSPTSIPARGREIEHRITNPELIGNPTEGQIIEYAKNTLKELSQVEYTVHYSHGYCPVKIGDCVRLNYSRAGLNNIKAKVISQSIACVPGCQVTETAVYTINSTIKPKLYGEVNINGSE